MKRGQTPSFLLPLFYTGINYYTEYPLKPPYLAQEGCLTTNRYSYIPLKQNALKWAYFRQYKQNNLIEQNSFNNTNNN